MKYKCLSIAGFDGSGGAGLQADLKTFSALGCYGMTVITALPVQNTCGVRSCYGIPVRCIEEQLEAIFDDIVPDAIKIGMLFSVEIIETVGRFLKSRAVNIPVVLDPVMFAKSGHALLESNSIIALKTELIPLVDIITPNLPEAEILVSGKYEKRILGQKLLDLGCKAILLKGGHDSNITADDLFLSRDEVKILSAERIISKNTHGTGCTLSAAIASFLAKGELMVRSCELAKEYLFGAIQSTKAQSVGKGQGPVNHFYKFWN